jgi:putative endonuclease
MTKTRGEPRHFVYIVRCANGSFYTGYSTDVEKRVATHNAGKGARYTRAHLPVTLCAVWSFQSKGNALRAERVIKGLPRAQKVRLVEQATRLESGPSQTQLLQTATEVVHYES